MRKTAVLTLLFPFSLNLAQPSELLVQLRDVPFVSGLSLPAGFAQDPSDASIPYIVQRGVLIRVIKEGVLQAAPFLDLTNQVAQGGEPRPPRPCISAELFDKRPILRLLHAER
jgi:hypothetical protein